MNENVEQNTVLSLCPFCGSEAIIKNEVVESCKSPERTFDVRIEWEVGCSNKDCPMSCADSTFKRKCDYRVTSEGILQLADVNNNGRQHLINKWNAMAIFCTSEQKNVVTN